MVKPLFSSVKVTIPLILESGAVPLRTAVAVADQAGPANKKTIPIAIKTKLNFFMACSP
jgi:hypothetical protein